MSALLSDMKKFLEFTNLLLTFRINFIGFSQCIFLGDLEGAGTLCPCTQATFKSPALLGLILIYTQTQPWQCKNQDQSLEITMYFI